MIKRLGSVENLLYHAEEVEKKTYRESLLNNRDVVLRSKELVTIDTNVPVHLSVETMHAQEPDYEACRLLFNELEFTTLLKNFVQTTDQANGEYGALNSEAQLQDQLKRAKGGESGIVSGAAPTTS